MDDNENTGQHIDAETDRSNCAADESTSEIIDEMLIEEISIDGMCGVY